MKYLVISLMSLMVLFLSETINAQSQQDCLNARSMAMSIKSEVNIAEYECWDKRIGWTTPTLRHSIEVMAGIAKTYMETNPKPDDPVTPWYDTWGNIWHGIVINTLLAYRDSVGEQIFTDTDAVYELVLEGDEIYFIGIMYDGFEPGFMQSCFDQAIDKYTEAALEYANCKARYVALGNMYQDLYEICLAKAIDYGYIP